MKRHLSLLASVLLVLAMVFAFASCDLLEQHIPGLHKHDFVDGKCECGEADPDYVAPHEHNFVDGKCECGEADPSYSCVDHVWSEPVLDFDATCTKEGRYVITCTKCGYERYTPIFPYDHEEVTIPGYDATCTATGLTDGKKCTVCGKITVEQEEIPAAHTETEIPGVAPTCTATGLTAGVKCSVCDEIITAQVEIPAAGHNYVDGQCACGLYSSDYVGDRVYVLDVQTMTAFSSGAKADGDTGVFDVNSFYTIYYSAKTKVDSTKDKVWSDGYTVNPGLRLNWGGTTAIGETTKNAIKIVVDGTATIKIWWVSGGNGREIGIFDENGDLVTATFSECEEWTETVDGVEYKGTNAKKNELYLSEITISKAGTYYIGTDNTYASKKGGNIIFKVETTVTPATAAPTSGIIDVATTDTYCNWCDADVYTFTAKASGTYTFTVPAGLGVCSQGVWDSWGMPEVDCYDNASGATFTVDLAEGEDFVFHVSAVTKDNWTITWTFAEGEVGGDDPIDPPAIDYPLSIGSTEVSGKDVNYVYSAPSEGTLTLQFGNAIMGPVEFSYSVNGGDAVAVELGTTVTLELVAGDKVMIYVVASGYSSIKAEFSGEQGGEDPEQPEQPVESDLVIGENSVTLTENDLENGVDLTFVVTVEDTYSFNCDYLLAIVFDSEGLQIGRGQVALVPGVYTVKFVPFEGAGTFTVTITGSATEEPEEPAQPNGSYDNPFEIESFPYEATATVSEWGTVYYTFVAPANGYITVTATEGALETICINDKSVTSIKYAVLAGNTYTISIYNDAATEHKLSVAFEEAELTADDYKSLINNSCANDADYNWSASFSALEDGRYIVNVADGDWTSNYYYTYEVVFNADGTVTVTLGEILDLSDLWLENTGDEYAKANKYDLLLTPAEYGYTLEFVEAPEQTNVGYTISANNSVGLVYFNGGVSGGRFTGSYDAADAVVVYIEKTETDGEVLIYFFNGETKTYIVMGDKTTYCSTTTTASGATAFEWNAEKNTYVVADDANNRAFGFDRTKNFTTFSAYDVSGDYNWGQFTEVA